MTFLLDTSAFSDGMSGRTATEARLSHVAPTDQVLICSVVRGEVLYGLGRLPQGRRRRELEARAASLFARLPCEPIPEAAGDHYARIRLAQERMGLSLDDNDLWIAATALALGAVLVTRDSDSRQVPGLLVEDWSI